MCDKAAEFKDIYVHGECQKVFCFRTGMAVYEEIFADGRYMASGRNNAGYTPNVLEAYPTRFAGYSQSVSGEKKLIDIFDSSSAFEIEADGVSLDGSWEYVSFEKSEKNIENTQKSVLCAKLVLKSSAKPIEVSVHTVLDGTPIINRFLEVKNLSDTDINISAISPMCGGIETIDRWKDFMHGAPDGSKIYSLGYMDKSIWGHEGFFKWHNLPEAEYGFSSKYICDRFRHPFFVLKNNLLGSIMIANLAWSGGYKFEFNLNAEGDMSKLSFKALLYAPNPMLILAPHESFKMPEIHIGTMFGDLDCAVNVMHAHLRKSVFSDNAPCGKKGWIECGMGAERLMDIEATKHFADTAAKIGAETLIIDAGWNCPPGEEKNWALYPGDWYPDKKRYPNGIEEIRDYVHKKGLKFGLWAEVECLGKNSEIRKNHPDWMGKCYNGTENRLLDMSNPDAAKWVEGEIVRMIEEYKLDIFRLDFNGSYRFMLCRNEKNGIFENTYLRYYKNAYDMFERLKKRFPNVIFENCAAGGGRTDIGFVKNFTHTWVSDCNTAPRSFAITNGMTMALPPENIDRLASGMNCHTKASLDFQMRNIIFARPTCNDFNAVGSVMNTQQIEFVRHTLDIYKNYIRPYIDDSKIYHHTPELLFGNSAESHTASEPCGTGVIERASGDKKYGVIGIFKLADAECEDVISVYPEGVDVSQNYKVTFDNSGECVSVSGYLLKNEGIRVKLSGSLVSELIIYEPDKKM